MSERLLVSVSGLLGAGKTRLTDGLVAKFGFESRNVGDELARIYRRDNDLPEDYPVSGLQRMEVHKEVRQTDPDYFSRYIVDGDYTRRAVDGLRNLNDAEQLIRSGGLIVSLVAPRAIRFGRRDGLDLDKDPSIEAMTVRELSELNDPDIHGSQALRVMALSRTHGFFIDATQAPESILEEVSSKLGIH